MMSFGSGPDPASPSFIVLSSKERTPMISAHPGLPEFDYIRPKSLAEASRFLADHPGESRPFLGGQTFLFACEMGSGKKNTWLT
jgi:hypothetical protein